VGVSDVLPKLIVYRLLEPAFRLADPVQIVCREGKAEFLLAELAMHGLDLVLSDAPVGTWIKVRAFSHLLGECPVSIFGTAEFARSYKRGFPRSLNGAPFLLPTDNTSLRRNLEQWFDAQGFRPVVRGEFEDNALLKAFGQAGVGLFPAPAAIEKEIVKQYCVRVIGRIDTVRERFFAISVERKIKHPAVVAIVEAARAKLFS
jgi:LysR family transcriptional activator of nhaA